MIRVLRAEESLDSITVHSAGSGMMKQHDREAILNDYRRDARRTVGRKSGAKLTLDSLIADGLGVQFVSKGKMGQCEVCDNMRMLSPHGELKLCKECARQVGRVA